MNDWQGPRMPLMKYKPLDEEVLLSGLKFTDMDFDFTDMPIVLERGEALHIEHTEEGVIVYRAKAGP